MYPLPSFTFFVHMHAHTIHMYTRTVNVCTRTHPTRFCQRVSGEHVSDFSTCKHTVRHHKHMKCMEHHIKSMYWLYSTCKCLKLLFYVILPIFTFFLKIDMTFLIRVFVSICRIYLASVVRSWHKRRASPCRYPS